MTPHVGIRYFVYRFIFNSPKGQRSTKEPQIPPIAILRRFGWDSNMVYVRKTVLYLKQCHYALSLLANFLAPEVAVTCDVRKWLFSVAHFSLQKAPARPVTYLIRTL